MIKMGVLKTVLSNPITCPILLQYGPAHWDINSGLCDLRRQCHHPHVSELSVYELNVMEHDIKYGIERAGRVHYTY